MKIPRSNRFCYCFARLASTIQQWFCYYMGWKRSSAAASVADSYYWRQSSFSCFLWSELVVADTDSTLELAPIHSRVSFYFMLINNSHHPIKNTYIDYSEIATRYMSFHFMPQQYLGSWFCQLYFSGFDFWIWEFIFCWQSKLVTTHWYWVFDCPNSVFVSQSQWRSLVAISHRCKWAVWRRVSILRRLRLHLDCCEVGYFGKWRFCLFSICLKYCSIYSGFAFVAFFSSLGEMTLYLASIFGRIRSVRPYNWLFPMF